LKKRKQKKEEMGKGKKGVRVWLEVVGECLWMFVLVMNPKELKVNRNLTFLKRS
jgi:hypothetical protein